MGNLRAWPPGRRPGSAFVFNNMDQVLLFRLMSGSSQLAGACRLRALVQELDERVFGDVALRHAAAPYARCCHRGHPGPGGLKGQGP